MSAQVTQQAYMILDTNHLNLFRDDGDTPYGRGMLRAEFERLHDLVLDEMRLMRERETPLSLPEKDQLTELFALLLKLQVAMCNKPL
jgi:hypothetical protein